MSTPIDDSFHRCFLCGATALWAIEVSGEDEKKREEPACAAHARGHIRRGLLTEPPKSTSGDEPKPSHR